MSLQEWDPLAFIRFIAQSHQATRCHHLLMELKWLSLGYDRTSTLNCSGLLTALSRNISTTLVYIDVHLQLIRPLLGYQITILALRQPITNAHQIHPSLVYSAV